MTTSRAILLLEDNEDDVFLMKRALQSAHIVNPAIVVETGREAMDYLSGAGSFLTECQVSDRLFKGFRYIEAADFHGTKSGRSDDN